MLVLNHATAAQICSALWLVFCLIWLVAALRTKRTEQREPLFSRLLYSPLVVLSFLLVFAKRMPFAWLWLRLAPRNPLLDVLGVGLTALGIALAVWARFYIGQNWSGTVTVKVGHELVRSGPYAWVRHPIYSGLLLALLGTALVRDQVRGLLAVVLLWLGFDIKRRIEERFMLKTFGAEYGQYMSTTGAVIPRLRT